MRLIQPTRPTIAYIYTNHIRQNIGLLQAKSPGTGLIAVVKANAYGHGIIETSKAALDAKARFLGVAIPEEGARLRQAGISAPILVMSGILKQSVPLVIENDLSQTVFSRQTLAELEAEAERQGKQVKIHIKVDTGMNRVGVKSKETFMALLEYVKASRSIELEGLYTHFAEAEAPDAEFTAGQAKLFIEYIDIVRRAGFSPLIHAANSAALFLHPTMHFDLVRPGLAIYGVGPSPETHTGLIPALEWKTRIVHLKTIQAGESVSYGRTFTADGERRIATLAVGYGDGYKRVLGNKADVLIRGRRARIVGTICMDQCMADVTDIPDACVGDEVVLLGKNGNEAITADEMALWADTISYEILLSISERVPRVYIDERRR